MSTCTEEKQGRACIRNKAVADRRLQRSALARVVRLVEDSVGGRDQPLRTPCRVPREAHAWGESLLKGWDQPCRYACISRVEQPFLCVGHHCGLPPGNPQRLPVVDLGVRE